MSEYLLDATKALEREDRQELNSRLLKLADRLSEDSASRPVVEALADYVIGMADVEAVKRALKQLPVDGRKGFAGSVDRRRDEPVFGEWWHAVAVTAAESADPDDLGWLEQDADSRDVHIAEMGRIVEDDDDEPDK
jgi:hypothetical protein